MSQEERASPLADEELSGEIMRIIEQAATVQQLKKGANETTKTLNRGTTELIVLAADAKPLEIILHLPLLCEEKSVPYIFVNSKAQLGQACGTTRSVIACSILKDRNSSLTNDIDNLKILVEKCFYGSE